MTTTGIVRRIDSLGRIVIPKEIRKTLKITDGEQMEMNTTPNGEILIKKYSPMGNLRSLIINYAEVVSEIVGKEVCMTDTSEALVGKTTLDIESLVKVAKENLNQFTYVDKTIVPILNEDRDMIGEQ